MKFSKFPPPAGRPGPGLGPGPPVGLSEFRGLGSQKVEKSGKKHGKSQNFQFFKNGPSVEIWVSDGEFRPKTHSFYATNKILKTFPSSSGLGPSGSVRPREIRPGERENPVKINKNQ